jgi:hypothetical protein
LIASPTRMTVGTAVSAPGRSGRGRRRRLRRRGEREQRVVALGPAWSPSARERPCAVTLDRAGGLALHDDAVVAVGVDLTALEAQARVEAGEARDVGELAECATPRRRRAAAPPRRSRSVRSASARRTPSASTSPPFMSMLPGADQAVALAPERLVVAVADDGVDVAEQDEALGAAPAQRDEQVRRVVGGRARHVLDARRRGCERCRDGRALRGAARVAARRGHADERLELALGGRGDQACVLVDPLGHGRRVR